MRSIFVIVGSSCIFWRCQEHIFFSTSSMSFFDDSKTLVFRKKKVGNILAKLRFFSFLDFGDQLFLTPCYAWYIWIMDMHDASIWMIDMHDAWSILMIDIHDAWSILMIDVHDVWSILMIDVHDGWSILMIDIHDGWSILMIDMHDYDLYRLYIV